MLVLVWLHKIGLIPRPLVLSLVPDPCQCYLIIKLFVLISLYLCSCQTLPSYFYQVLDKLIERDREIQELVETGMIVCVTMTITSDSTHFNYLSYVSQLLQASTHFIPLLQIYAISHTNTFLLPVDVKPF